MRVLIAIALLLGIAHAADSIEVVDACGNRDFVSANETPKVKVEREKWAGRVVFPRIRIIGAHLPATALNEIREELRNQRYQGIYSLGEIEERARDWFQTRGYFKVRITPELKMISGTKCFHRVSASFQVEQGQKYLLGKVYFLHADSSQELRTLFPIKDGALFDTSNIREGLENLRKAYGRKGFINFTAVPDTKEHASEAVIDLNIDIDTGKQFHVRQIGVAGLADERFQEFYAVFPLKEGAVYDSETFERFFVEHPEFVPRNFDILRDVITKQDFINSTVDLRIDLSGYHIKWPDIN